MLGSVEIGVLVALVVLVVVVAVAVRVARHDPERDMRSWAGAYGVRLTPANADFVRTYLRTGRRLRFVCAVGGLIVPPLLASSVDPHASSSPSLIGLIVGYLVGSLWAELSVPRPAAGGPRVATLSPRRLEEYLPARLRWGLRVVGALLTVLSVAALVVEPRYETGLSDGGLLLCAGGIAYAAVVEAAERWILRRPQPFADPDLVAADDAVRASSVHALAGSGISCLLLLQSGVAFVLANSDAPLLRWTMPWVGFASFFGAMIAIRYYVYRAWRVRRTPARLPVDA